MGNKTSCTMEKGKHITNISLKGKYGYYKKSPKLQELYEKLFGNIPENLHNSLVDCKVCLTESTFTSLAETSLDQNNIYTKTTSYSSKSSLYDAERV